MSEKITGQQLAQVLSENGFICDRVTRTSIQVKTSKSRLDEVDTLLGVLKHLGAKYDSSASGSSIGAIIVDNVKILIKSNSTTNVLAAEELAIRQLNVYIMEAMVENGGSIAINCNGKIYHNIVKCESTKGTPKSDFHLVNNKGESVIWISHKKGKSSKDFQQWGGITEKEIATKFKHIFDKITKIIKADISAQKKDVDIMPNGESYFFSNIHKDLKMMSVYGVKYGAGYCEQNVQVLLQGNISLKKSGNHYELHADGHVHYNGDEMRGEFEPGIAVIYKGDRSQLDLRGARATVSPAGGRKYKKVFKL